MQACVRHHRHPHLSLLFFSFTLFFFFFFFHCESERGAKEKGKEKHGCHCQESEHKQNAARCNHQEESAKVQKGSSQSQGLSTLLCICLIDRSVGWLVAWLW